MATPSKKKPGLYYKPKSLADRTKYTNQMINALKGGSTATTDKKKKNY